MAAAESRPAPYPVSSPYAHGRLEVGDGHSIYWEVCGRPEGKPAVVLHGGPGSGVNSAGPMLFDPAAYRVVLFDQRGCGRSTPSAARTVDALSANTTQHLIADIESLRKHLAIDRWLVLGASWGSVLGLAYARRIPVGQRAGPVLGRRGHAARGRLGYTWHGRFFPEEWKRFQAGVPDSERDGDLSAAYYRLLLDPDPAVHEPAAQNWCDWDDRQMRAPGQAPSRALRGPGVPAVLRAAGDPLLEPRPLHPGRRSPCAQRCTLGWHPGDPDPRCTRFRPPIDLFWRLARDWPESELVVIEGEGHLGGAATDAALVCATDRVRENR